MATHTALIAWNRTREEFVKGKYSREHTWTFDTRRGPRVGANGTARRSSRPDQSLICPPVNSTKSMA